MYLRISDLLDEWADDTVELVPPPAASPDRIRERTRKLVTKKRPKRRPLPRLLVCAALAAVLSVSAVAAYHLWGPGELFDAFFALESAPLNDGQKALLDEIGTTDLPPSTSNGTTLTPLAAIADEHTLYIRLRLEAPVGTVLPDMGEKEAHIFRNVQLKDTETGQDLNWGMQKARFLPDDTPGDNSLELVFMLLGFPEGANWIDGTSKTLTVQDLLLSPGVTQQDGSYLLLEGEWSFELNSFYQSKSVEVDTSGAARWDEETGQLVTLEELTLSPLSAAFTISYPVDEDGWPPQFAIELVYRDGSTVAVESGSGTSSFGPDGLGGYDYFTGVHSFDAPIDLEQIDHIQFGETSLYLP